MFKKHSWEYKLLSKSKEFNKKWYLQTYPDVAKAKVDPIEHYINHGWKEGRNPGPTFNTVSYLTLNPDVRNANINPLIHWERFGRQERRNTGTNYGQVPKQQNKTVKIVDAVIFPNDAKKYTYDTKNIKTNKKYKRIAVFASYSGDGTIADYVVYYLKELKKVCDAIVFVADNPIIPAEAEKIKDIVIYAQFERHNEYDFGSYKRGYMWLKKQGLLKRCDELLLCNDSCYGPVYPLKDVFDKMSKKDCDFWGMIQNDDVKYHLQSWFYLFKHNVLTSRLLDKFFEKVQHQNSFWDYVFKYEFELTRFLIDNGFVADAFLDLKLKDLEWLYTKSGYGNITVAPLTLIQNYNFPFIKIKCFTNGFTYALEEQPRQVLDFLKTANRILYDLIIKDLKRRKVYSNILNTDIDFQIKNHDIISFDIFDTLLIRPYVQPTDLFYHMEKIYNIPGFADARIKAEMYAREKSNKKDITFDEIYENLLPKYQKLKATELQMEQNCLQANPLVFDIYQKALKQNKTIIIVSDMYLSSKFLKQVLQQKGYEKIDDIYVSGEYGKTKGDGSLFEHILKKLAIKPEKMLHIGDNHYSDIKKPREYGISAYQVPKYIDLFFMHGGNLKYKQFYETQPDFMRSYIVALIAQNQMTNKMSYWQQIGYSLAGPLCLGYTQMIAKETKLNDIDTLLFVSRDGYLLQKAYNKICNKPVENRYIYAPRILNLKLFGDHGNQPHYIQSYMDILLKNIPDLNINTNKQTIDFKQRKIVDWHTKNKTEYEAYIKTLKIYGTNIASVDMTTGAYTSQKILERVFKDRYKMSFYSACFVKRPEYKHVSYLPDLIFPAAQENIINLTELLITAPELPVVDIKDKKPVYKKSNAHDEYRIKIIQSIEQGVMKFIDDFCIKCGTIIKDDMCEIPVHDVWFLLESYCRFLSNTDKSYLKHVYHSADIENKEFVSMLDKIIQQYEPEQSVHMQHTQEHVQKQKNKRHKLKPYLLFPYYLLATLVMKYILLPIKKRK